MSGISWFIVNIALIFSAVYCTVAVARRPEPKPLELTEPAQSGSKGDNKADVRKNAAAGKNTADNAAGINPPGALPAHTPLDDLWEKSLFNPARTEIAEDGASAEEAAAALASQNIEFELIGIAQIAPVGAEAEPVAVLRSKVAANNSNNRGRRPQQRRGGAQPASTPASNTAEPNKGTTRQVFRVGDKINETGYTLKSISPGEKMVEVTRGGTSVKLYINFTNAEANQRREAANQAAIQRKQAEEAAERQRQAAVQSTRDSMTITLDTKNPGMPPPPPGTPNGNIPLAANNIRRTGGAAPAPVAANDKSEPSGDNRGNRGNRGSRDNWDNWDNRDGSEPRGDGEVERAERLRRTVESRQHHRPPQNREGFPPPPRRR